jgi:MEDS: MEthanogen/methylotroph, DcmR Sensory domain
VCAFFASREEEYAALLPFINEGLERGEKACHTVDPRRRDQHLARLAAAGLDVRAMLDSGQLELRDWASAHLSGGGFDRERTRALFAKVVEDSALKGYPLVRFVSQMEWALEAGIGIDELLEYEAKANETWIRREGPVSPVICTYDIRKFSGEVVVEIMRTHPLIVIGGILQENPFFVPPEEFLRERRKARSLGAG